MVLQHDLFFPDVTAKKRLAGGVGLGYLCGPYKALLGVLEGNIEKVPYEVLNHSCVNPEARTQQAIVVFLHSKRLC